LAILGGSFRLLAKAVLPLALLFILSACGSSKRQTPQSTVQVRGPGFAFQALPGWHVSTPGKGAVARRGAEVVSVTRFSLLKPYDPAKFGAVAKELDRVAAQLAKQAGASLDDMETITVDGRKVRVYGYGGKRIAFVLDGRREYQLFCVNAGDGCDLLFHSFALSP
jgi:hypothetical protein